MGTALLQATDTPETDTPPTKVVDIRPQAGPQEQALACTADIMLYGGAAGGGKTWSLLLEPCYHIENPAFGATIFRRTVPEITKQGAMWDESFKLYTNCKAKPNSNDLKWTFESGATVQFSHLQHEKDKYSFRGAQICLLGFDQLESFTEGQFWYMRSRNRSVCGVRPYIRATCNPIPDDDPIGGWLHRFMQWWIDPETGLAIKARSGVARYFVRINEQVEWADTPIDLARRFPEIVCTHPAGHSSTCVLDHPQSVVFIHAELADNKLLEIADPTYRSKLMALPLVERERLLGANWNARPTAGKIFNRAWFKLVAALPADLRYVRYTDKAGTDELENPAAAYTASVRMGRDDHTGQFYVTHVVRGQWSAGARENVIRQMAQLDGLGVDQWVEQEPGSGGKESAQNTVLNLAGYNVHADRVTGDKLARANPYSAQVEAGNVHVLIAEWTEAYINELHNFDPEAGGYKDQVDASSGAFNKLALSGGPVSMRSGMNAIGPDGKTAVEREVQRTGVFWPGGGPR